MTRGPQSNQNSIVLISPKGKGPWGREVRLFPAPPWASSIRNVAYVRRGVTLSPKLPSPLAGGEHFLPQELEAAALLLARPPNSRIREFRGFQSKFSQDAAGEFPPVPDAMRNGPIREEIRTTAEIHAPRLERLLKPFDMWGQAGA